MLDRSFLPAAHFEFVVIADTHYMLDPTGKQVEFNSRRRQTARTEYALQQLAALNGEEAQPLIIHMGDLIQEFPEQPAFVQARGEALAQIAHHGLELRQVAGNHDVGDKPDPTMPASWVTPEFLADYHEQFGRSWYSWDVEELHFVVLNSQIMNSTLPEAAAQETWLAQDLAQHAGKRIFLFLHLPPFIHDAAEPHLGHYDNLGEPARSRLLALVQQHRVERVFAAHIHWAFYNHIGETHFQTVPSVAFTRPGFSELFSSAPPAEQGRDDVGKLGFFLVRVYNDAKRTGSNVHFIRTGGNVGPATSDPRLVTGTSADLPHSPLGIVARHPIAPTGQVPAAWPSTIRQPVRNDYGLLALLELGVRHLRVPAADLTEPVQRERLALLRDHGIAITGQWLYDPSQSLVDAIRPHRDQIDGAEVVLLGSLWPDHNAFEQLDALLQTAWTPTLLSCVVPGNKIPGKQHNRSQIGYQPEQLPELNQRLAAQDITIARLCVRLEGSTAEMMTTLQTMPDFSQIGAIDWLCTIPAGDPMHKESTQINSLAAAIFGMRQRPNDNLWLEPLVDLDRTMDSGPGLLDRTYNPRSTFHLLRHLNTLLFCNGRESAMHITTRTETDHLQLSTRSKDRTLSLVLPTGETAIVVPPQSATSMDCTYLLTGTIRTNVPTDPMTITEPTLFYSLTN